MTKKLCSVAISCLNEEDNIEPLYAKLNDVTKILEHLDWEFIFVDDGSTDSTWNLLMSLHAKDHRVKAIRLSRNFGAHEGTAASIYYAQGDAIISMGADLQDPPEIIVDFVQRWENGSDIVWGVRQSRDDHPFKVIMANAFYKLINFAGGVSIPQNTGSFCLISRHVANAYNNMRERNRVTFELIGWSGFQQAFVPFDRPARNSGVSKFTPRKLVKTALDSLFAVSALPIRIVTLVGTITSVLSGFYFSYILTCSFFGEVKIQGWSSLLLTTLLASGLILLSIGIIGEYLWRILDEIRSRPIFIAKDIIGTVRTKDMFK